MRPPPRPNAVRIWSWAFAAVTLAVLLPATGLGAAQPQRTVTQEYDLKAAFLFNFAQFVEWPAEAFAEDKSPFVIGVLGDDPFGSSLDEILAGEIIRNRPLIVRRYPAVEQADSCQIPFLSSSEGRQFDHDLKTPGHRKSRTLRVA